MMRSLPNWPALISSASREDDLIIRDRAFVENIEGKKHVIKATLEGHLTLREAAAQFQNLNLLCPEYDWQDFAACFQDGRTKNVIVARFWRASSRRQAIIHPPPTSWSLDWKASLSGK